MNQPLSRYRHLILDLPGVLVDTDRSLQDSLRELSAAAGQSHNDDDMIQRFDAIMASICAIREEANPETLLCLAYVELSQQLGQRGHWADALAFARRTALWPVYEDVPGALLYLRKFFALSIICPQRYLALSGSIRGLSFLEGELCTAVRVDGSVSALYVGACGERCPPRADWCYLERNSEAAALTDDRRMKVASLLDLVSMHQAQLRSTRLPSEGNLP